MATSGTSSHPHIIAISTAEMINRFSGGTVIRPWEIEDLPGDWVTTFRYVVEKFPGIQAGVKDAKKIIDDIKRSHPQYGKRRM